jgi:hypothetical protein
MRRVPKAYRWIVWPAGLLGYLSATLPRPYPLFFWAIVAVAALVVVAWLVWLVWPPSKAPDRPAAKPRPPFEDERRELRHDVAAGTAGASGASSD